MTPEIITVIAGYIGMAGGVIYVSLIAVFMTFHIPWNHALMISGRAVAWGLMLAPLMVRWYLSRHMLLWLGLAIIAVGGAFKFRDWLSG